MGLGEAYTLLCWIKWANYFKKSSCFPLGLLLCVCMCACISLCASHTCRGPQRPERALRYPKPRVIRIWKPPDVYDGNWAEIFCKSSKHTKKTLFIWLCILPVYVSVHHTLSWCLQRPERVLDPLGLELQTRN